MKKVSFTRLSLLLILASVGSIQAQEVWSLQRCIGYALDKNLTIKQSQASLKTQQIGESQARAARLPNLGLNSGINEQFGRTIDPVSNTFSNQAITSNSLNLNAGVPLYSGGRINNTIQQAKLNTIAAESDLQQTTNTLALQVASAYLTILLNTEQLGNTKSQLQLTQKQLVNTQKLIDAGNLPLVDRYNVEAQIASQEQNVITAENNLELAYLSLKQLMQMEADFPLTVEQPEVNVDQLEDYTAFTLGTVYEKAKTTQPSLTASEYRVRSAEEGIKIAKSSYLPSVSFFANLNSFYSSQSFTYTESGRQLGPIQTVNINGTDLMVGFYNPIISAQKNPYFTQVQKNFGQSLGLNINVPIYQNGSVHLSVERAKLAVLNAELQQNQVQQQLKNDIQTSLANARAAKKQYEASQKTFDATQLAFTNTEKRHAIGAVNTLELNTSKNNLDVALNNRTLARYNYIFRVKILEFYLGKPLVIEQK